MAGENFSVLDDNEDDASSLPGPLAGGTTLAAPQQMHMPSPTAAPAPVPPAPVPPPPLVTREFGDSPTLRDAIFARSLEAARAIKPVKNNRYQLSLHDVDYTGNDDYSLRAQKKALLSGGTVSRKLQGTWKLHDLEGNEVGSRKAILAKIPYMTDRGTFINSGTEYSMSSQLRLRPGVYTRTKANGLIESHVNVKNGPGHKMFLDPATGVFKIAMHQSEMPVVPLLKAMGVTDTQIREAWGDDLAATNLRKDDPQVMSKLYKKLVKKPVVGESETQGVVAAFNRMTLDPEVSTRTLGKPYGNMSADAMLDTTKKLLSVSRGESEGDDRDAMPYQTIHGPEDVISERLTRNASTLNKLLWKASNKSALGANFVNALDDDVKSALLGSRLGMPLEEINLAEVLDQQGRISRMGEGGIASMQAVPSESRAVHPSHLGFLDSLRTAESGSVGVDLRLASNTRKGPNNTLYTSLRDKHGNMVDKTPSEVADGTFAFPGELQTDKQYVAAIRNGRLTNVHRDSVDFELPSMEHGFSPMANLVPGRSAVKGQRLVMASRMMQQALPLTNPEAPFVQAADPDKEGDSYEQKYAAKMGAVRATKQGRVFAVTEDGITIKHVDGTTSETPLANNFPLNRKTFYHQTATVKPGDPVNPGQLLTRSNFTDGEGTMALGKNLRVAYLPYDGKNWEDASVISESAAKLLSSEHMYKHDQEWGPQDLPGKNKFLSIFPSKYTKGTLDKFDDGGAVLPGTVVKSGDPLILAVNERERNKKSLIRGSKSVFQDKSTVWDHAYDGVVTDVVPTSKGVSVVVKAVRPTEVGDKVSGRYGEKGVIAHIVPDGEMPHDESGNPYHILVSPLGITSRTNPMQMVENALGKIAEKTGKPYKLKDFDNNVDLAKYALEELDKHGLSDTETVVDPRNGRRIKEIATGNRWFMKLHHMSDDKLQGRGLGAYSADGSPAGKTDQSDSSKRLGMLETNAILSSGATQVLREAGMIRGQANPKYWSDFMSGYTPHTPDVPFVYEKFVGMMKSAGINPVRNGTKTHLMAMTDKDIDQMTGDREIKNAETVDWKTMEPIAGGLFDQALTGGHGSAQGGGNRWAHIKLHTPLPNPVMEDPIRRVLGLTKPKFEAILASREDFRGETGPAAIHDALKKIDLTAELAKTREQFKSTKKTARDEAVRKLGFLKTAERQGIHPSEWMVSKVPVLPPTFRPVSTMGPKKLPLVDDANYLYKELFDSDATAKELGQHLDSKDHGDETLATYNAFKAVTGLGDPIQAKNKERGVTGILQHILGSGGPKTSMIQRKLLGATTDFVTRGVIIPNPELSMDQVAIPEKKAWSMYQPMIVRRLVRGGMSRMEAMRAVEAKQPSAQKAMRDELEDAVVLFNRAPTLHRYGIMAARPVLTKNNVIEISPLVTAGLGADFDGDQMNIHALTTRAAKDDALAKMLPSANLFNVGQFRAHQMPSKDYVAGLHEASTQNDADKPVMYFDSNEAAIRAYKAGKIGLGRRVKIITT